MDRLLAMQVFSKVVEAGSFTGAARRLDMPNATVTTLLQNLESHLGVRLINRTTRRMHLTDDGAAYYERCQRILAEIEETENALARTRTKPQGRLRVDLPTAFGRMYFVRALPTFLDRYPDIKVMMTMTDRRVDFIEDGIDAAVRGGPLEDSTLIAKRIHEANYVACASPEFIRQHGQPKSPRDLKRFRCLGFYSPLTETVNPWNFERVVDGEPEKFVHEVDGRININSADALIEAAVSGAGIVYLLDVSVSRAIAGGQLKPLLTDWQTSATTMSVVYPQTKHLSAKVRVFVDFVASMFPLPRIGEITVPGGAATADKTARGKTARKAAHA
jgi:LysR family transcriptional regulator for bpeEF and oprC